jgi:hypothetical protein
MTDAGGVSRRARVLIANEALVEPVNGVGDLAAAD